jgi:hypothetical protein
MRTVLTAATLATATLLLTLPATAHKSKRDSYSSKTTKHDHERRHRKVRVRAPYTAVDVNTKRRQVHIRAPGYNQVIRW